MKTAPLSNPNNWLGDGGSNPEGQKPNAADDIPWRGAGADRFGV